MAARFAQLNRNAQKKCEVRPDAIDGKFNDAFNSLQVEPTPVALISDRRIVKAVAKHNLTSGERRTDNLTHQLRSACVHQEQLRFRSHRQVRGTVFERVPDLFTDGCAAGLTKLADWQMDGLQAFSQPNDLRRFTATFRSLEGDE